jgi:Holliday junction resolvase
MPNKNYVKAAEYERALAKHLRTKGAAYVTRTPGSRSPVDVIACFDNAEVHLIQCKLGKSRPKRSEIDFLRFMVEMGYKAYFVTKTHSKRYQELSLDEVESGPVKDG